MDPIYLFIIQTNSIILQNMLIHKYILKTIFNDYEEDRCKKHITNKTGALIVSADIVNELLNLLTVLHNPGQRQQSL